MATGPQHYRKAEQLLANYTEALARAANAIDPQRSADGARSILEAAQVHATLALAAATAQNIRRHNAMDAGEADEWIEVCR